VTIAHLNSPTELTKQLGEAFQILGRGIGYDIDVFGPAYVPPSSNRKAADEDEANIGTDQPGKKGLQSKWFGGQALRALPANVEKNSLNAMVSARLTDSGR
jgi:hypothetical protein